MVLAVPGRVAAALVTFHARILRRSAGMPRPPKGVGFPDPLSGTLNISEKNSIRNRTLRDSIEHFDERLDQWTLKTNNSFAIVDRGFFDDYDRAYGFSGQPMPKDMIFRAFNFRSHSYIFMGAEYDIALMSKDLIVIQTSVEHFTRGNELELYSLWIEV